MKILDIVKKYDIVKFNAEKGDKYDKIVQRFCGSRWVENGRHCYCASGVKAWETLLNRR
jgi:hypothetical protein